jgi:hypothetical protein
MKRGANVANDRRASKRQRSRRRHEPGQYDRQRKGGASTKTPRRGLAGRVRDAHGQSKQTFLKGLDHHRIGRGRRGRPEVGEGVAKGPFHDCPRRWL